MTDFPLLRSSMAERQLAFDAARGLGFRPGRDQPIEERLAWQQKHNASDAAYRQVRAAYASELLPAILGGEWAETKRSLFVRQPGTRDDFFLAPHFHDLFDHPLHFRRRGAKGPLTWKNCVLIGQPYPAEPDQGAEQALALARHFGVGVWRRDDLSAWYPGVTMLVIAAQGLTPQNAQKFGFKPLSDQRWGQVGTREDKKAQLPLGVSSPSPLSTPPVLE